MVKVETPAVSAVAAPATPVTAPAEKAAAPASSDAAPVKEGGSKVWLWVGIIVAVIAVAGLAYWLLI